MSAQDNVASARAFIEAFNAHGLDVMAALAPADAAAVTVATGETFHGRERSWQTAQGFVTASPDGGGFLRGEQGHA